ncbi:hypothetical protein [Gaetbulibacter aestuarii]|uniref:Uncharacterized protein n=1 Tax=Gaetbulibacter aestuarii TaxID=1502358 RepID=A0ABW7MYY2_9FLAO
MHKNTLFILFLGFIVNLNYAQESPDLTEKRFEQKIDTIVEQLVFNYQYDQALREYLLYKTFDKSVTDSIENLKSETDRVNYIISTNFKSDLARSIWEDFIHPSDDKFTENLMDLCNSVGYPSLNRIKKYYKRKLPDEFNPVIFFGHSREKYWDAVRVIAKREFENGHMGKCDFGYVMWHTSGRKENAYLDEGGIKYIANSKGRVITLSLCEDE